MPLDPLVVRLIPRRPVPPFALPSAAFTALDSAARAARVASFAESPCGAEESTVLAVWLDATPNDPEADRTELLRGCPDFLAGDGRRAFVAWLHQVGGFAVESGKRLVPATSDN
jgi:hypothetical protein